MKGIGFSPEECIRGLQSYCDEIDEILALFDKDGRIIKEKTVNAQHLLQGLKGCLRRDYKRRETIKGQNEMTMIEQAFFFPAIHEALTQIYVRPNSNPSKKWIDELSDAKFTIRQYLDGLKKTHNS